MQAKITSAATRAGEPVIALHCSGGGAGQWRALGDLLAPKRAVIAPEQYGTDATGPWTGERAFTLADEAARVIDIIDRMDGSVHLVGHSYGGAVALRVAVERAHRIASLALYEPSAFHVLKMVGRDGVAALAQIVAIGTSATAGLITGDYHAGASSFVDYWGGNGAWAALRPSVQAALIRWLPKVPLDFRAAIDERTPTSAYAALDVPTLILRGEHAPGPSRLIAQSLAATVPGARAVVIQGAGHMGPLTHAEAVNRAIGWHIAEWADNAYHQGLAA